MTRTKIIQSKYTPPYIDATEDPYTIRFSENDITMEYESDAHCGDRSMVLWKKNYSLSRNILLTGRALGHNGRDVLDEVDFALNTDLIDNGCINFNFLSVLSPLSDDTLLLYKCILNPSFSSFQPHC